MRHLPFFALLFGVSLWAIAPIAKTQQPTLAPCQCQSGGECTCVDCQCEAPAQLVSVMTEHKPVRTAIATVFKPAAKAVSKAVDVLTPIDRATIQQKRAISKAAQAASPSTTSPQPAPSANQGSWVYAGTSCNGGVCSPRYEWVPAAAGYQQTIPQTYTQPVYRFRGPIRRLFGR